MSRRAPIVIVVALTPAVGGMARLLGVVDRSEDGRRSNPRGVPRLTRLFDGWMEWIHSGTVPRGDILTAAAFEFDNAPDGPMRAAVVEGHGKMHGTIERMARQAIEAGQFGKKLDAAQFAFEFLGIVHAHHHVRRLLRTDLHAKRARAAFERLLESSSH